MIPDNKDVSPRFKKLLHEYAAEIKNGAAHQAAVRELGKEYAPKSNYAPDNDPILATALKGCQPCSPVPCKRPFCVESRSCEQLGIQRAHVIRAWYCDEL